MEQLAVLHAGRPEHVVDVVDVLQVHRDPLEAVGELGGDRPALEAAHLLEVGELGDLHPVAPDLPAEAPGPERRRLPVVLDEADVVLEGVDAKGLQAPQVELLHVLRRGLQHDLELVVLVEAVGVLAVAAVGGPPRRLDVGDVPRLGAERPEK